MTNREFYEKTIATSEVEELVEKAKEELAKLDARNANRKTKPSKKQIENAQVIEKIKSVLTTEVQIASEIAEKCEISIPKASSLLSRMDGVTITKVKVPKKGEVNGYALATE